MHSFLSVSELKPKELTFLHVSIPMETIRSVLCYATLCVCSMFSGQQGGSQAPPINGSNPMFSRTSKTSAEDSSGGAVRCECECEGGCCQRHAASKGGIQSIQSRCLGHISCFHQPPGYSLTVFMAFDMKLLYSSSCVVLFSKNVIRGE